MNKKIAIIGDNHNSKTQVAIAKSIVHSNKLLGLSTTCQWIETTEITEGNYKKILKPYSGIWSASGSPFKNLEGSLNAIKYARENGIPHLGTCGGYQHAILEYARNVTGILNANHAEYESASGDLVIDKLVCSLVGTRGIVKIKPGSFVELIYKTDEVEVAYYCSFGLNDKYYDIVLQNDFIPGGFDKLNTVRIIELKNHPFFVITAFVPQVDSSYENPDKLITAFVNSVNS